MVNKIDEQRAVIRQRLVTAARLHLSSGGALSPALVHDICRQVGVHPHGFRSAFASEDSFLDAINESLVEECAARLRARVDAFVAVKDADESISQACIALADSWPLTRGGVVIRANRRLRALEAGEGGSAAEAERRFVVELLSIFGELMRRLGREFTWPSKLAVRVILDTYERSFEAWVMNGNEELAFSSSPYVQKTMPIILTNLSARVAPQAV